MKLNEIIDAVHASKLEAEICAIIEFELPSSGQSIDPPGDYVIESPTDHEFLAFDGSGGEFYLLQDGRVLFLGQGSAGVVARDFCEFIGMTTGLASWRDALNFVEGDDLESARSEWGGYAKKWGLQEALDEPWFYGSDEFKTRTPAEAREQIAKHFGVLPLPDPFRTLFTAVKTLNGDVRILWEGKKIPPIGE